MEEEYSRILRIALFEYVQKFPYKVGPAEGPMCLITNGCGDCRHKHNLLYELFKGLGLNIKKIKVMFNWKDLPLPNKLLNILKKSDTIWGHNALLLNLNGKEILVDATWPKSLSKIGFPVTLNWDGLSNTEKITNGKLKILSIEEYEKIKPTIKLIPNEVRDFANELNNFLKDKQPTN